jgi:hypothetical protein
VFDTESLRSLADRLPLEMFEDFILMGNADDIAERLRPYAAAGLEFVLLADMSSVVVRPEDAARAFQELHRLTQLLHDLTPATASVPPPM